MFTLRYVTKRKQMQETMDTSVQILQKLYQNSKDNLGMKEIAYLYLVQSRKLQIGRAHV